MYLDIRSFTLSLLAVVLLGADVTPAQAGCADYATNIPASCIGRYARYYVPYAIQASAAYRPIGDLDDRRGKIDPDGFGADVNYVVQTAVQAPDENLRTHARNAFRNWRYQFGSDSYLGCIDPDDADCKAAFQGRLFGFGAGPAFQVWARTRAGNPDGGPCSEVSIAVRGTTGSQWDWLSNFGRFGSPADDYYHQLRRNVDGIIRKIQNLDCYRRASSKPQIVSTGHSLGGGLAQLLALASKPGRTRITKVFAFDPSPVTGARLVAKPVRLANAQGLTVDRIYQEGEALSYTRDVVQEFPPASSRCNPLVRTVKVDVARGSAIALHGMALMTTNLVDLSYDENRPLSYRTPPAVAGCTLRYQAPTADPDEPLVASGAGRQALFAFARASRPRENRLARAVRPRSLEGQAAAPRISAAGRVRRHTEG